MIAFNGTYQGKPAILAHVYGSKPVPTSFTLPFVIGGTRGTFGTTLTATLPAADGNSVTGIELVLSRRFSYRGHRRSFCLRRLSRSEGLPRRHLPFAKASYTFVGGKKHSSTLTRSCRARG